MTREQVKALLPVLTAYAAGESVQIRNIHHEWNDVSEIHNFSLPWRVKPKQREWWICRPCRAIATYKPIHKCVCGASYTRVIEVPE